MSTPTLRSPTPGGALCDGGMRGWVARQVPCPRCYGVHTWLGWYQLWYDTEWTCTHCGARNGYRGSPAADRRRALTARREFTAWLIAGSPTPELP